LKNNTFVKYRDATRRIIMISTKLPLATYPCVNCYFLLL
jgi:hypothetical protein